MVQNIDPAYFLGPMVSFGFRIPAIVLRRVIFPAPFGPRTT
jgi:hypothetical protein